MTKTLTLLALSLSLSSPVLAYPKIGDQITQIQTVTTPNGRTLVTEINREIGASNPGTFLYLRSEKNLATGATTVIPPAQVLPKEIVSEAQIAEILRGCRTLSGNRELIQIGSKTVNTCRITLSGTTVWYGHVPFGVVQVEKDYDESLGGAVSTQTRSFQFGL